MVQRTIAGAVSALENLPGLSDQQRAAAQQEIDAARTKAANAGTRTMDDLVNDAAHLRQPISEELCSVRDDLEALAKEGELGRISAPDFAARLVRLRDRHRAAERQLSRLAEAADRVSAIEEDPVAYGEHLFQAMPMIRPHFSF